MKTQAFKKIFLSFLFLLLTLDCAEAAYRRNGYDGYRGDAYYREDKYRGAPEYGDAYDEYKGAPEYYREPPRDFRRPGGRNLNNYLPVFSSFEFYQIGDTDLVMGVSGRGLPAPEVSHFDNKTMIVFREVYGERARRENRSDTSAMIRGVLAEQVDGDFVITITTELPLQIRSVRGTPPSDSYTLRLTTVPQHQKMIEEPVATQQPQTLKVPTGPFAVTTPINLDLRDTELRDVFRMLGVHLKKNVIIHDSVPPVLVTMTLKNTPLSEVFSYLMKTYDITYESIGKDTIVIGTADGLSKVSGKEETRVYRIAYADVAAVQTLVTQLTGVDRVVADPRLRTLYVTSNPLKLEEVAIVIQNLDNPGKQIMLHARILEFTDGATKDVEAALNAVYDHWWFSYTGTGGASGGIIDDNRRGRNYTEPTGAITSNVTDMLTPMQGVWREFDGSFRALETKGRGKTLANPSVITIDGQEANISLTEDYPYISGRDDGGNPTWSTETVGPQFRLTPRLGRDGVVSIQVNIETGEVMEFVTGSTGEQMPRTSTRSVTTNVRVRDGEPFVIGGLFRENDTRRNVRVPVLGSIPLLGEIFNYRYHDHQKTQVVIIVIPYVLNTPDVAIEQERVMIRQ
ncbi:MAG: secretion protein [Synergistaceae bacterium]|nr:secretion protein [Synergistaceae bacterium]